MSLENDTQRQGEPTWEQMANRRNRESPSAGNSRGQRGGGVGGNRNGRQSGNFNNKRKRKKKDSDRWMNLFLILLLLTIIVLAILYFKKDKDDSADPAPTGQAKPSGAVTPGIFPGTITPEPSATPMEDVSVTPEPTATISVPTKAEEIPDATPTLKPTSDPETITPSPTVTVGVTNPDSVSQTPTPSKGDSLSAEEANDILAEIFWEAGYRFTLSDSNFSKGGVEYFRYDVTYGGKIQDYDVLVEKEEGKVYFYEDGAVRKFDDLPDHSGQESNGEKEDGEITADLAAELLGEIPYASLGLPAALDECSLVLDNWKTVVAGEEAYCLNVFYQGALAGNLYFTEDAEHIYYLDEFGEFVKVR